MLENNRAAPQSEEDTAYPQKSVADGVKGGRWLLYCAGWRLFFCFPHRQQPNLLV